MTWLADKLAAGLDATVLELHLQPVVSLESEEVVGAESFVRWRDPVHGLVPPRDWIPLAESTGAIVGCASIALPWWAACSAPGTGTVVSFNLGGRQLLDNDFMVELLDIPADVAAGLALEIPYLQFSVDDAERVAPEWSWIEIPDLDARLGELHGHGFSVWLDDYDGTIRDDDCLLHHYIDVVKLDRSLLELDRERLGSVVERIHTHGKRSLVEGVERPAHVDLARRAGVELAQGFLYGPPVNSTAAGLDR